MRTWKASAMLAGALAAATLVSSASAAEPLTDPSSFAAPPDAVRPAMRWWWGPIFGTPPGALSTAETRKELGYLADAGFKRVEIAFRAAKWATRRAAREPRGRARRGVQARRDDRHDGRRGVAGALAEHRARAPG